MASSSLLRVSAHMLFVCSNPFTAASFPLDTWFRQLLVKAKLFHPVFFSPLECNLELLLTLLSSKVHALNRKTAEMITPSF